MQINLKFEFIALIVWLKIIKKTVASVDVKCKHAGVNECFLCSTFLHCHGRIESDLFCCPRPWTLFTLIITVIDGPSRCRRYKMKCNLRMKRKLHWTHPKNIHLNAKWSQTKTSDVEKRNEKKKLFMPIWPNSALGYRLWRCFKVFSFSFSLSLSRNVFKVSKRNV